MNIMKSYQLMIPVFTPLKEKTNRGETIYEVTFFASNENFGAITPEAAMRLARRIITNPVLQLEHS